MNRIANGISTAMSQPNASLSCSNCDCNKFLKTLGWIPVSLIWLLILWSVFVFSYYLAGGLFVTGNNAQAIIYLIIFIPLAILFLWSYWMVMTTNAGIPRKIQPMVNSVPSENPIPEDSVNLLPTFESQDQSQDQIQIITDSSESNLTFSAIEAKANGAPRFCKKCQNFKPDRAHHCSSCGHCVLKMDHHCPWINNCVGFLNYSFFYLFVSYGLLYCLFVFCCSIPYLVALFGGKVPEGGFGVGFVQIFVMCILAGAFVIALFIFVMLHTHLLLSNVTTLESMDDGTRVATIREDGTRAATITETNIYNIGRRKNVEQVFGPFSWKWFIPIKRDIGDGHSFPHNTGQV